MSHPSPGSTAISVVDTVASVLKQRSITAEVLGRT